MNGSVLFFHLLDFQEKQRKAWPLPCLLPLYFYLNECNVVGMLEAFPSILLPTLSKLLFPPNSICLGLLGSLAAFPGMDCNIFLFYSEYFTLLIFKLAF